ncbi:MAG: hydroxyacylglutathione hydrolase [Frankiaceae bacterium]|nr:hydroxyacylglutathione hydrolase [Frankiaceae bacterium]
MRIESLETPCLGNRSYVVIDGPTAVVVDPPRDIDRIEDVLRVNDAKVGLVLETHRHADYLSGGLELARRHRADYVVPPGEPQPMFRYAPATEGTTFGAGAIGVRVMATPGHTPHHVAYVIESADRPVAVCTGGSLLHGSVGRTDLYGADRTWPLARDQWRSVRRLVEELPTEVMLLPTHGFGSLCSAAPASDTSSATLGEERQVNPALLAAQDPYVRGLVGGYGPVPRHYSRLAMLNALGPAPIDLSPPPLLEPLELAERQSDGHWLIDLRDRRSFAQAHLRGSVNVEATGPLAAYLPWILPAGAGVVLLGSADAVTATARQLAQVGIDRPIGVAVGSPQQWSGGYAGRITSYAVSDFAGFVAAAETGGAGALDVRSGPEWVAGHVAGALHLALPRLAELLDPSRGPAGTVSRSGETWVYCGGGFRAAIAASLLDAAGLPVTLIDAAYDAAVAAGLTVTEGLPVPTAGNAGFVQGGAIR